jgi:hypothetical protein
MNLFVLRLAQNKKDKLSGLCVSAVKYYIKGKIIWDFKRASFRFIRATEKGRLRLLSAWPCVLWAVVSGL